MKLSGKRSAGNSHAAFDEAGDGNGDKETTAPLLDPTWEIGSRCSWSSKREMLEK